MGGGADASVSAEQERGNFHDHDDASHYREAAELDERRAIAPSRHIKDVIESRIHGNAPTAITTLQPLPRLMRQAASSACLPARIRSPSQARPAFFSASIGGPSKLVSGTFPVYPMSFMPTGVV